MNSNNHAVLVLLATAFLLLSGSATAMSTTVGGLAVGAAGDDAGGQVGTIGNGDSLNNAIEYFIPLRDSTNGTYGVGTLCGGNGAGTCSDSGFGSGYPGADALAMNIFFDLGGLPQSDSASLSIQFDDLDLTPVNDPLGFFESVSLSYWNWNEVNADFDPAPVALSPTITSSIAPPPPSSELPQQTADDNLILWDLDLAAINALNASAQANGGFWIQLGFGSLYDTDIACPEPSGYSKHKSTNTCDKPYNTPEYLTAALTVSAVPVPAAFWLFGSALIGFIGISRRTRVS